MEVRDIFYIKAISDFGNMTKASEYLHITQPSLSQSLKKIEAELGVELFIRTKRGMTLTAYGRRFISDAIPLLSAYEDFIDKVSQYEDSSSIRTIGPYS